MAVFSIKNSKLAVCTGQRSFCGFSDSEEDGDVGTQEEQLYDCKNSFQLFEVV